MSVARCDVLGPAIGLGAGVRVMVGGAEGARPSGVVLVGADGRRFPLPDEGLMRLPDGEDGMATWMVRAPGGVLLPCVASVQFLPARTTVSIECEALQTAGPGVDWWPWRLVVMVLVVTVLVLAWRLADGGCGGG